MLYLFVFRSLSRESTAEQTEGQSGETVAGEWCGIRMPCLRLRERTAGRGEGGLVSPDSGPGDEGESRDG
jgi:hypothetical protein